MNDKNKNLSKNTFFYLIYNVLNVVFPFATGIYVARVLLSDSIGLVESARNLVQYFVILAFLGIPTYGLREISKYRNDKKELSKVFSELVIINFISTCFFGVIYLALIFGVKSYRDNLPLYLITGVALLLNFFNISWLYEGLEEFRFISIRNLLFKILSFILLVVFVRKPEDFYIYALLTVLGTAGNYVINVIASPKYVHFSLNGINLRRHMKQILFLVAVNLAIEIYSLVDVTMLSKICTPKIVAYYSYGMKIYKILLQVVNTFTIVLVPRISFYFKNGNLDLFNKLISKTFKIIFMVAIPMVIGIWFVSDYLIVQIYGEEYINSSYVLKILSISLLLSPIGYLLGSRVLLVTNREKFMIIPVAIGAVTNVILNLIFINLYEEVGAAIASVIGEFVVMVLYIILSKKYFKLENIINSIIKILISSILITVFLLLINFVISNKLIATIVQIVGAIFIYYLSLLMSREELTLYFTKRFIGGFLKWKKN